MNSTFNNSSSFTNFTEKYANITNLVILIFGFISIVCYVILNAIDTNNTIKLNSLRIITLLSFFIMIFTIVKKYFLPEKENENNQNYSQKSNFIFNNVLFIFIFIWGYIKYIFREIWDILKKMFGVFSSIPSSFSSFFENITSIFSNSNNSKQFEFDFNKIIIIILVTLFLIITPIIYFSQTSVNLSSLLPNTEWKQILYGILITLVIFGFSFTNIYKLYENSKTTNGNSKIAIIVSFILLISGILLYIFSNDISKGNYTNFGSVLFDVLIFSLFLYFLYGIKKFFIEPSSPNLENYSTFEYFLYYYLFPILFFIFYVIYYIYIYKNKNLEFTDYKDYRVIIYNILNFIIGLYLLYNLVIKQFFKTNTSTTSTSSTLFNFINHAFSILPCFATSILEYLLKNPMMGLFCIGFSIAFIFFLIFITSGTVIYDAWYMILFEIIGIIILISGIIKALLATTNLGENKIFKLLEKTLLLIPCLFLSGFDNAFKGTKFGTANELMFIILLSVIILFYKVLTTAIMPDLYEKYIIQTGKQLINNPISLKEYTFISSYNDLFKMQNNSKYDYKYGLSFWIYLNSFAQSSKIYEICTLGDGLIIKYNPVTNILYFMYKGVKKTFNANIKNKEQFKPLTGENIKQWNKIRKQKKMKSTKINHEGFNNKKIHNQNEQNQTEQIEEIIIYKHDNGKVLLQKWNNIIVNYYGGTLDIFINGNLVKSTINVAPYIQNTAVTIGESNGVNGDIANMIYYNNPLTKTDIYRIYNIFKNKNPPVINKNKIDMFNFSEIMSIYLSEIIKI